MALAERATRTVKTYSAAPVSVGKELLRMLPDALVLGSGLFAIITLSFSHAIFFLSMLEGLLAFHGFRALNNYLDIINIVPLKQSFGPSCRTGFTTLSSASLSLFANMIRPTFPSAPMFMMGLASAYVVFSMNILSKELEVLGKEYTDRYYISVAFLSVLTLFVGAYRLYYSCDSPGSVIISTALGAITAGLIVVQNTRLFGESSLNLIGVPLLRQRTASGEKLYICPTQNKA